MRGILKIKSIVSRAFSRPATGLSRPTLSPIKIKFLAAALLGLCPLGVSSLGIAASPAPEEDSSTRLMIHLLDYLGKDYGGAVGPDGKIQDEGEYAEQIEFADRVEEIARSHPALEKAQDLREQIKKLVTGIHEKTAPENVSQATRAIQTQLINLTGLATYPKKWPDQKLVLNRFQESCSGCHGVNGRGDGPLGQGLDPKPSNFRDLQAGKLLAPYQAFNTIRLGVPGTGMPSFSHLSEDESWSLAFYVVSLRYRSEDEKSFQDVTPQKALEELVKVLPDGPKTPSQLLPWIAMGSDASIIELLGKTALKSSPEFGENSSTNLLQTLRFVAPDSSLEAQSGISLTQKKLTDSFDAYQKGEIEKARQLSLEAYLEGLEPIEPRLASLNLELMRQTEHVMMNIRRKLNLEGAENAANQSLVKKDFEEALRLMEGWQELDAQEKITPKLAFFATLGIVLREGFEAALLVLSLLLITRVEDRKNNSQGSLWPKPASLSVHLGWMLAIGVGLIAWFSSETLLKLSGSDRELLEGVTSLFAVLMLIALGLWIHRRAEIQRWNAYLNQKVYRAINHRNYWALGSIAFLAVFREALETVLFLRTLTFDGTVGVEMAMLAALVTTSCLIFAFSWIALTYSIRLPTRKIFAASSWIMLGLAVILTGKGLHALQESGHLPSTELVLFSMQDWDVLGFYPTLETLIPQIAVALCLALWALASVRVKKQA
jgi:high-affinity iron transporter